MAKKKIVLKKENRNTLQKPNKVKARLRPVISEDTLLKYSFKRAILPN